MLKITRLRRRTLAAACMATVFVAVGGVSYQASASEVGAPAAKADAKSAAKAVAKAAKAAAKADGQSESESESESEYEYESKSKGRSEERTEERAVSAPDVPLAIKPPPGSRPIGAYLVQTGTQNYTCGDTGAYASSIPEAELIGTGGRIHHFGGPSWQSERDGSLVTATKVSDNGPRPGAVLELLLKVNSHAGYGILGNADYINRLYTSGGLAPAGPCTPKTTVAVPYKAVYVFWDAPA